MKLVSQLLVDGEDFSTSLISSLNRQSAPSLIHGENGAGKTALLNAILWCATGQTTPSQVLGESPVLLC